MGGLFTQSDCTPEHQAHAGYVLTLTNPVEENGTTLFRGTVYARVPVDERCQTLLLSSESVLEVRFEPTTVDVRSTNVAWVKKWSGEGAKVIVELKRPALIEAVHSAIYAKVELHRVDGQAVVEDATVKGDTGVALEGAFVAASFQAAFSELEERTVKKLGASSARGAKDKSDDKIGQRAATTAALSRIDVSGKPTAPRLRLLDSTLAETLWQWIEPGEQQTVSYTASGSDLAAALEPALRRALELERKHQATAGSTVPITHLVLPLVVESDAPCRVVLAQANLGFLCSAELLSTPADLTFDGSSRQKQTIALPSVPEQPLQLDVEATLSLLAARAAEEPPELSSDARYSGIALEAGSAVATLWEAERPYWLIGFAVGWYALSESTTMKLSLFADVDGQPAAQTIVDAEATITVTGAKWARCTWNPVAVQPGRYWLKVSVSEGSGLWLGEANAKLSPIRQQGAGNSTIARSVSLNFRRHPLEPAASDASLAQALQMTLNGLTIPLTASATQAEALRGALDTAAVAATSPWTIEAASSNALRVTLRSARVTYRG